MGRKGNARPYSAPSTNLARFARFDDILLSEIGPGGTIASIVGQVDADDYVRQMVQQIYRAFVEGACGSRPFWAARALYQQLVGRWKSEDEHRLNYWIRDSSQPEIDYGTRGLYQDRKLTDRAKAELARLDPLP
jgi:hypothetical protein